MMKKVENDAAAYVRGIAKEKPQRGMGGAGCAEERIDHCGRGRNP